VYENCSTSLSIKEMQNKSTMSFLLNPSDGYYKKDAQKLGAGGSPCNPSYSEGRD
jgi:hypothetical protein